MTTGRINQVTTTFATTTTTTTHPLVPQKRERDIVRVRTTDVVVAAALAEPPPRCDWEGIIKPRTSVGPTTLHSQCTPRVRYIHYQPAPRVSTTRLTDRRLRRQSRQTILLNSSEEESRLYMPILPALKFARSVVLPRLSHSKYTTLLKRNVSKRTIVTVREGETYAEDCPSFPKHC